MRQKLIIPSLQKRVSQPGSLLVLLALGGLFCLFRLLWGGPPPGFLELAAPFLLLFANLALSPVPWQWTGDDQPRANLARGFLQALGFHTLWIMLLLLLLGPQPQPGRGRFGPPEPPPARVQAPPMPHGPRPFSPGFILVNVAFAMVFGWVLSEKEATEARETRTAGLLREAQSRALQNQLEPHVLFNALNSLSELVHDDPLAAEEMIARLADLYRTLTRHGRLGRVSLGEERKLVAAYLAMEEMRLGDRLRVAWDWPDGADALELPPLLLQPLVENAIKHGISPAEQGGEIRIAFAREAGTCLLTVANSGQPFRTRAGGGVGLANLESRLALWPAVAAGFSLEWREPWTLARLRWTLQESP